MKILIVDDEEDLTWSIAKGLNVNNEFQKIYCANSAESALEILAETPIHLLVTDIRMPGIGGIELVKRVSRAFPEIMIIVMSAFDSVDDLNEDEYQFQFIEKPFEIQELKQLINKSLHFNSN